MDKEKIKGFLNSKKYYFVWFVPTIILMYYFGRKLLRYFDSTAALYDIGMIETILVTLLFASCFVMFSLWTLNLSFKHLMDFYMNDMRKAFNKLSNVQKCAIFILVFFLFYLSLVFLAGKIMGGDSASASMQFLK